MFEQYSVPYGNSDNYTNNLINFENELKSVFNFTPSDFSDINGGNLTNSLKVNANNNLRRSYAQPKSSSKKGSKASKKAYKSKRTLPAGMIEFARIKKEAASLLGKDGRPAMSLAKIANDAAKSKLGIKSGEKVPDPKALANEAIALLRKNFEAYKKLMPS